MKENKGISLITLIVTIIVVMILATIVIRVGTSSISESREAAVKNEIREIETAAIKRASNYIANEDAYPLIGIRIDASTAIADICENLGHTEEQLKHIETNIEYVRKLDSSSVGALGIQHATGNTYIVDYLNGKVYGPIE